MQLLFVANRHERRDAILEWIAGGVILLCDWYRASSIAYGEAQGLDPAWLEDMQRFLPAPNLTIYVDIAPETAAKRKAHDRDRYERDLALLGRVRDSYLRQSEQASWIKIDESAQRTRLPTMCSRPLLLTWHPRVSGLQARVDDGRFLLQSCQAHGISKDGDWD